MTLPAHFEVLRTIELRELLEDEEKLNKIIRYSQKFQGLKRAIENMLASNHILAESSLSRKPAFRNSKLLLGIKYQEMKNLASIIQAKQDQLEESYTIHAAQRSLLKKITDTEEECEILFQKCVEGKTSLVDFLTHYQNYRTLYHVRVVLVKKMQEIIKYEKKPQRSTEIHSTGHFSAGFPEEQPNTWHSLFRVTPIIIPAFYDHCLTSVPWRPPVLLPFVDHVSNIQQLQHTAFRFDTAAEPVCPRTYGHVPRWPARPFHLQRLKMQPRTHPREPH